MKAPTATKAARPPLIDRVVGWLNPAAGLDRHIARTRLARAYEAANPRDGWKPRRPGASADADHLADAALLRTKARALVQNVPYIRAGLDALVAHTVGTGITPTPQGPAAEKAKALFQAWSKVCDADGRLSFYALQAAAYRAMEADGEVLVRLRPRRPGDGLPVPLQLQLLEIDWLDTGRVSGAAPGNSIVNGIEYDWLGRTVGYWLFDQHPGDTTFKMFIRRVSNTQSSRVPAENIVHLFRVERPGQSRGFTRLAPVIARTRDLSLLEDAELARKNLETRLSVLVSGDASKMLNSEGYDNPNAAGKARESNELGPLPSGGITQLPQGVGVTVVQPTAAPGHVDHVKYQLHIISAGFGVPYEMCTGDMAEVNFSSSRVRINDFRRACEQTQWLLLVPRLCEPLYRAFIDAATAAGKLPGNAGADCEWTTPKWDYVNPQQETAADIADVSMGLSSVSEKIRRRGYDPKQVFKELGEDFSTLRKSGVLDVLLLLQRGSVRKDDSQPAAQ